MLVVAFMSYKKSGVEYIRQNMEKLRKKNKR